MITILITIQFNKNGPRNNFLMPPLNRNEIWYAGSSGVEIASHTGHCPIYLVNDW